MNVSNGHNELKTKNYDQYYVKSAYNEYFIMHETPSKYGVRPFEIREGCPREDLLTPSEARSLGYKMKYTQTNTTNNVLYAAE